MAISNKTARKIKRGIGPRMRSKTEIMQNPAGVTLPAGVQLYIPPSKPKPAVVHPFDIKMGTKKK